MTLVDTSVWVDHLREGVPGLAALLEAGRVLHPFVLGELACGNLRNRAEVLDLLGKLPPAPVARPRSPRRWTSPSRHRPDPTDPIPSHAPVRCRAEPT